MVALVYCTDKYYFKISDNFNAQNIDQSYFICEAREFAVSKVRLDLDWAIGGCNNGKFRGLLPAIQAHQKVLCVAARWLP